MTEDPGKAIVAEVEKTMETAFNEALEANRSKVSESLFNWLSFTARKKDSENLPEKIEEMRKRIDELAQNLKLGHTQGHTVVKVTGEAASTLRMLERGTDWFDPADNVTDMIVGAVLE